MMRKLLACTAALLMLTPSSAFSAADGTLALNMGGEHTEAVCEAMGYAVSGTDSTVALTNGNDVFGIDTAAGKLTENGHTAEISDCAAPDVSLTSGGRLFVRSELLSDLLGLDVRTEASGKAVTVSRIIQNILTVGVQRTDLTDGLLTASIQVPVLSGPWDGKALEAINGVFRQSADAALAQGRQNAKELASAVGSGYEGPLQCQTDFNYRVRYNQNGIVSVVLTNYQYSGGAHGSTIQTAYTFDLKTGARIRLSDLMKSGSGYQKEFSARIRKEIDARVDSGALYELQDSPFQTLGDNPDFYLSNDGIVFFFQQYEHFPYAAGIQEFAVPYGGIGELSPAYGFLASRNNRIA